MTLEGRTLWEQLQLALTARGIASVHGQALAFALALPTSADRGAPTPLLEIFPEMAWRDVPSARSHAMPGAGPAGTGRLWCDVRSASGD